MGPAFEVFHLEDQKRLAVAVCNIQILDAYVSLLQAIEHLSKSAGSVFDLEGPPTSTTTIVRL